MTNADALPDPLPAQTTVGETRTPNWQDQDDLLRELWERNQSPAVIAEQLGRSPAAIMTRAVRLGLPRRTAPGRKPGRRMIDDTKASFVAASAANGRVTIETVEVHQGHPALRVCLMCLNKFQSAGRQNRICTTCRSSSEYAAGCSIPDISFKVEV
ncbi:hypothetical protein [Propionivibrio sp.]|uniref:hypothetical protein n=1 Tax=Propionivibrio sp. TaxID=2212460 RepID=UPI002605E36B|nr:hypothetical protein [Propionivibrio sp.]